MYRTLNTHTCTQTYTYYVYCQILMLYCNKPLYIVRRTYKFTLYNVHCTIHTVHNIQCSRFVLAQMYVVYYNTTVCSVSVYGTLSYRIRTVIFNNVHLNTTEDFLMNLRKICNTIVYIY